MAVYENEGKCPDAKENKPEARTNDYHRLRHLGMLCGEPDAKSALRLNRMGISTKLLDICDATASQNVKAMH